MKTYLPLEQRRLAQTTTFTMNEWWMQSMANAFLAIPTTPDVGLHNTRQEVYGGMDSHPWLRYEHREGGRSRPDFEGMLVDLGLVIGRKVCATSR